MRIERRIDAVKGALPQFLRILCTDPAPPPRNLLFNGAHTALAVAGTCSGCLVTNPLDDRRSPDLIGDYP